MSKIPRRHRRKISEPEFLEIAAKYEIDCRMSGMRIWFHDEYTVGKRRGNSVSPAQVIEFVRTDLFEGRPKLQFFVNIGSPGKVGVEFTDAGRKWRRAWAKYWRGAVNPPLPNRFKNRKGCSR